MRYALIFLTFASMTSWNSCDEEINVRWETMDKSVNKTKAFSSDVAPNLTSGLETNVSNSTANDKNYAEISTGQSQGLTENVFTQKHTDRSNDPLGQTERFPNGNDTMDGISSMFSVSPISDVKTTTNQIEAFTSTRSSPEVSIGQKVLCLCLYPIVCFAGIATNGLSMYTLQQEKFLSVCEKTFYAMSFMDVATMISTSITNGLKIILIVQPNMETAISKFVDEISPFLVVMRIPLHLSKFLTVLIAFERFIAVYSPLKANIIWKKKRTNIIILIVFTSLGVHVGLGVLVTKMVVMDGRLSDDRTDFSIKYAPFTMVYGLMSLFLFNLPLIAVTLFTVATIFYLRKNARSEIVKTRMNSQEDVLKKTTVVLSTVTIMFMVTELPGIALLFIVAALRPDPQENEVLNMSVRLVSLTNSVLNAMLYVIMTDKYKKRISRIFSGCSRGSRRMSDQLQSSSGPNLPVKGVHVISS